MSLNSGVALRCYLGGESPGANHDALHGHSQPSLRATFPRAGHAGAAVAGATRRLRAQDRPTGRRKDQRHRHPLRCARRERRFTRIIAANSAQAKGRVERNHGTHQDRLVKKLRRKKIKTYAAANEFLEKEYLQEHNQRFRHVAAAEQDYHRPAPKPKELDEIFRLETERVIGNDWVVRYENRYL